MRITPLDEECRVHIMRHKDRTAWIAKANSGDRDTGLCLSAISRWMNVMSKEYSACACCDTVFPDSENPARTFFFLFRRRKIPKRSKRWLTPFVDIAGQSTRTNGLSIRASIAKGFRQRRGEGANKSIEHLRQSGGLSGRIRIRLQVLILPSHAAV